MHSTDYNAVDNIVVAFLMICMLLTSL